MRRPFEEIDILFAKEVSPRKFAQTDVNAFDKEETATLAARYSAVARNNSIAPAQRLA
jgi:hypothetical protein